MNPRIKREMQTAQEAQARAYKRLETLRETESLSEAIMALRGDYWSFWADSDGIYIGTSLTAESIMLDSPVAELLSAIEAIVGGDFTSKTTEDGDVEYRLEVPGYGRVVINAYLTEQGICRKVVRGYEKRTRSHSVEVEEAVPVYSISCGDGA